MCNRVPVALTTVWGEVRSCLDDDFATRFVDDSRASGDGCSCVPTDSAPVAVMRSAQSDWIRFRVDIVPLSWLADKLMFRISRDCINMSANDLLASKRNVHFSTRGSRV